jgi:hypothetical protein
MKSSDSSEISVRYLPTKLQDVTFQKLVIWMPTAGRAVNSVWNLNLIYFNTLVYNEMNNAQFPNMTCILSSCKVLLLPRKSAQAVTILPYVLEASGSNLTWDINHNVWGLSLLYSVTPGKFMDTTLIQATSAAFHNLSHSRFAPSHPIIGFDVVPWATDNI